MPYALCFLLMLMPLVQIANASDEAISCENTPITYTYAQIYTPGAAPALESPIPLEPGPYLFIDDYLIAESRGVVRVVESPLRDPAIGNPLITGMEDGCFQPYLTVLRDDKTGRFRMWYGRHTEDFNTLRSHIGYIESGDGIHWERPARTLAEPAPIQFGVSVVDDGPGYADPSSRFKYVWHMEDGLKIAVSPDGLAWTPLFPKPVLHQNHDINGLYFDPIRKCYTATLSVRKDADEYWKGNRRITMQSQSRDLRTWSEPWYVLLPDSKRDEGEMQFYAMDGYLARGGLLIGMVKVLRDDLRADEPPAPSDAYGIGYTALAWSRDGKTWVRDTEPFFERNPERSAWDHSHAWIDEQLIVEDKTFLYYGGYARGHKVNRFEERQIGLMRMDLDRYVSRRAGPEGGMIRTPLLAWKGGKIHVNADAANGAMTVSLLDKENKPIPGYSHADCTPISDNAPHAQVKWKLPLEELKTKEVRLEFLFKNARFFGFYLSD